MLNIFMLASMLTANAEAKGACIRYTAVKPSPVPWGDYGRWVDRRQCSKDGLESGPLLLGDDDGWQNQSLTIAVDGETTVCLRHTRVGTAGTYDTGWICSSGRVESASINLGDDTGWTQQTLQVRTDSPTPVCIRHTRWSISWENPFNPVYTPIDTGMACSSSGRESRLIYIGDDTGWRDQSLWIVYY